MRPYLLILCFLVSQLALAQDLNFSSSTPLYPEGATNHNYTGIGNPAVDVSINISSSGAQTFGLGTPKRVSTGLQLVVNFATTSDSKQITIRFSQGVTNPSFSIYGIEKTATVQDRITISGERYNQPGFSPPSASASAPNLSPSAYAMVIGSAFEGTGDDPGSAASTVSFSGFVQVIYITYRSGSDAPTNPGSQGVTLGHISWSAPLPVSLLYFRAQPQPATVDRTNHVTLSWATTWERDADRFEVQRSRSLTEFGTIGQLPARGTTETRQLYTFSDDWPDSGTTYYRLRQVDSDGTATYSNIVAAVLDDSTPTLAVLESETPGTIRIRGRNLSGAVFSVVSTTGQIVPTKEQTETDGSIRLCGPFTTALYVVRADVGGTRLVERTFVR